MTEAKLGLLERLQAGPVVCAEGYLFELERRGYLQAGPFVPMVVLEHPEAVKELHREFVHAGSDIVEAFTYYGHREKLRVIGAEHLLESLNRGALAIAKEVAEESGTLFAGNICNTNVYEPDDPKTHDAARAMFAEQVAWAGEAGVDMIIAETFSFAGEAVIAVEEVKKAGIPVVATLALHREPITFDSMTAAQACQALEGAGADVVGLNCIRGPATLLQQVLEVRAAVRCHVAALPVPYRTTDEAPTFQSLRDHACDCIPGGMPFPTALDPFTCNRYELGEFAKTVYDAGVHYVGVCCGAGPHHIRSVAEALGKQPEASRYSPDMSRHAFFGTDVAIGGSYRERAAKL